jgi:CHAD domain-containing protein
MSYRVDPRLPLTAEIRRIASEELEKALRNLEAARKEPDKALHKCRKRLKNVRALLGLVRSGDQTFFRVENARYRDAAARLAEPREAAALIETIDRLASAFPKEAGGLAAVRDKLVIRRNGVLSDGATLGAAVDAAAAACRDGRRQLGMLALPERAEEAADVLAAGAGRALRRARKALAGARSTGSAEDFHALRKAVKAHAMHLLLLRKLWPSSVRKRVDAVEALGERLGELHDVFVLRTLADGPDRPLGKRGETRLLTRLLKRSEKLLRKACLAEAQDLFGESPRHQVKQLARKARSDLAGTAAPPDGDGVATGAAN